MNVKLLVCIGEHVHGERWKLPLAKQMNLSNRHILRWVNEGVKIGPTLRDGRRVSTVLLSVLEDHQAETTKLIKALAKTIAGGH